MMQALQNSTTWCGLSANIDFLLSSQPVGFESAFAIGDAK
jgi:hypothetical protein